VVGPTLAESIFVGTKMGERAAPKQSLSGVCPLAKRMTPVISVLLAAATTLFGLAILIAKGDLLKSAPGWLVPFVFTLSAVFFLLAAILAVVNWKRERKKDAVPPPSQPPPPPSVQVHQENKQEFNPTFSPTFNGQQNLYVGNPEASAAEQEKSRQESLVLEYMKKTHATVAYTIDEVARDLKLDMPEVRDITERLKAKRAVWSINLNEAVGGVGYFLEELHRPQPAPPAPKKPNTVTTHRLDKDDKPMP